MWNPDVHGKHLPKNWRSIRVKVLRRDDYRCRFCGAVATDVDHIGSRYNHNIENLRALCSSCHKKRTGKQGWTKWHQGRKRAKQMFRRPVEQHPGLTVPNK